MRVIRANSLEEVLKMLGNVPEADRPNVFVDLDTLAEKGISEPDLCILKHALSIMEVWNEMHTVLSHANHLGEEHRLESAAAFTAAGMRLYADATRFARNLEQQTGVQILPADWPATFEEGARKYEAVLAAVRAEKAEEERQRAEAAALAAATPVGTKPH